jgi:preprotein translocase subunit SecF
VRPLEAILLVLSLVILIAVAILFSRTSELREGIEVRKGETEDVAKRVNKLETQDVLTDEKLNALRELSGEVDSLRHEVARLREVEYVDRDTVRKAVEAELKKATAGPEEEAEEAGEEEEKEPTGPVGVPGGITTW